MKSKLRSVNTRFWDDTFVCDLTPKEKLLFLYLLTNPLTNLIGIYEVTIRRISFDTGLDAATVQKGLERFETLSKAFYVDNYIVLPNFLKNQRLNSNMRIAVEREFDELPKELIDKLFGNGSEPLPNGYQTIWNALGMIRKKESESEGEDEGEKENQNEGQKGKKKHTPTFNEILESFNEHYREQWNELNRIAVEEQAKDEPDQNLIYNLKKADKVIKAITECVEKNELEFIAGMKGQLKATGLLTNTQLLNPDNIKRLLIKIEQSDTVRKRKASNLNLTLLNWIASEY